MCAALAGCSADVSRFDLGGSSSESSPSVAQDTTFGSAARAEQTGSAPYGSRVARAELPPAAQPQQQPSITTSAIQPDPYAPAVPPQQGLTSSSAQPKAKTFSAEKGEAIEVQPGDTLYKLSRRHQVSVSELMTVNGLSSPALKPGQKLYLPGAKGAGSASATAPHMPAPRAEFAKAAPAAEAPSDWSGSYTVKQGDSLYGVARQHKVKAEDLARHNGIADAKKMKPGTVLKVPGNGAPQSTTIAAAEPSKPAKPATPPGASATTGLETSASTPLPTSGPSMAEAGKSSAASGASSGTGTPASTPAQPTMLNGNPGAPGDKVAKADTNSASDAAPPAGSVAGNTKLRWPVVGKIVSAFGTRADGTHNDGVNLVAPLGTDIHAAESGIVAYAGDELQAYGNLVLVRHDNGWVTAYAHADEITVKRGDRVKRGQVIAKAGRTGQVDQPQVHFELRQGGQKPVDPTPFMEKM